MKRSPVRRMVGFGLAAALSAAVCAVPVSASVPLSDGTGRYYIDGENGFLMDINRNTSVATFKAGFDGAGVRLFWGDVEVLDGYVGTGQKVLVTRDGQEETYTAVVHGDVTGDGNVNISDVMATCKLLATLSSGQTLEKDAAFAAAGVSAYMRDGGMAESVTISDVMEICRAMASGNSIRYEQRIHPGSLALEYTSLELSPGATAQIGFTVDDQAALPYLVWSSSRPDIASVDASGTVTAHTAGQAVITAECKGVSAVCSINVLEPSASPEERTAWITNLESSPNVRVRTGPATSYDVVGGFLMNQQITVTGEAVDGWYPVRGNNLGTGSLISGYTSGAYITFDEPSNTVDPMPADIEKKLAELRVKFPNGKYWNHIGGANNPDGWTDTPCASDQNGGGSHTHETYLPGECDCNNYNNAIQCMGFAFKIGNELYGSNVRYWTKFYNFDQVKIGDYIRYGGHSVIVIGKDDTGVKVVECNFDHQCGIRWDRFIPRATLESQNAEYRTHT